MPREASIPLVLWISTAMLVHVASGGGAIEAARTLSDRADLRSMVTDLREQLSPDQGTIEVVTDSAQLTPRSETNPAENPSAMPVDPAKEPAKPDAKKEPPKKPPPRPIVLKKVEPPIKPPEPPKIKPPEPPKVEKKPPPPPLLPLKEPPKVEAPKPPPPPPQVAKKDDEPKKEAPPPPPPPPPDRRTAVVQDVEKDQPDNPSARRIADKANTTKEETVARVRAYDGTPTAKVDGGRTGSDPEKGNSDENKTGHNEDKAGNKDHAPGEKAAAVATIHSNPAPPAPPSQGAASRSGAPLSVPGNTGGGGRQVSLTPPSAQPPSPATLGGSGPAAPETHSHASGNWSLDPANPGGDGSSRVAGVKREAVYQSPVKVQSMGFGAPGLPGGANLNLTMAGLESAVGQDKFKQERAADGEARRAKHRGASGEKDKLDWRAAVENYEPSVKVGNQTSLNAAASAFGTYLNTIHNRIHPIFADEFLQSLSKLPPGHKLNDNLVTFVEIVVGKDDGKIVRTGITKASGSTMFDLIAVNAARRAGPYGKPPDAIVSPDGNVYIHWEFHRDPYDACSSRNARPYMLKAPAAKIDPSAQPAPKPVPPPKPVDQRTEPPHTEIPVPLPVQRF